MGKIKKRAKRLPKNFVIWKDIGELLTLSGAAAKQGRHLVDSDLSPILKAALVSDKSGKIVWVGPQKNLPSAYLKGARRIHSLNGDAVLPGFIECHTHTVFAGSRAKEFEMRVQGKTYQQIAEAGGGIWATVESTRKASVEELRRLAQNRVDRFAEQGVTTLETKTGYGLDTKSEVKLLKVAQKLKGLRIISTYLGPHALSPDFETYEDYLDHIIDVDLPMIQKQGLATRVDMFVEKGYFNLEMATRYFKRAKDLGFDLTMHADQLTRTGAALLACDLGAKSADHLVNVSPSDIERLSRSEITCVLLPTSDFYIKIPYPPARELLDHGARVALSTDFNPGSSPTCDLSFVGVLARLEMKMKLSEVIAAWTLNPAFALGLEQEVGSLEVGKRADFASFSCSLNDLFHEVGSIRAQNRVVNGQNLKKA